MKKSEALKILGLSEGYTPDDIKHAHRQKIRENHPDRFTDPKEKAAAEDRTKLINEARDVLEKRKWEPEYGGARASGYSPYGNPYTGYRTGTSNSYGYGQHGRPSGYGYGGTGSSSYGYGGSQQGSHQGDAGDPFGDWPFETFVWTSWDDSWNGGRGRQEGRPTSNWDDWFSSVFTRPPEKTPEQELEEAKRDLKVVGWTFLAKMAMLAICTVTGTLPVGVLVYMAVTLLFAAVFESRGCANSFVGPIAVLVVLPFAASLGRALLVVWPIAVGLCIAAVVYDVSLLHRTWSKYRTAKEKASIS